MTVNLRSDGRAVDVVIPSKYPTVTKGDLIQADGWYGVACTNGKQGDVIAIETTQREFAFTVDASVVAAKGDILYIDATTGKITATKGTNTPALRVTKAKDTNNVIWAKLIAQ